VTDTDAGTDLRYLDAHSVRCPAGNLSDFNVCTEDAQPLGSVNGVLISPSLRQLRYFVIEKPGLFVHRRFLVPADTGAVLQQDRKTLQIEASREELELQSFKPGSVPAFSDDDLVQAMFARS
jgi:hypothetical protein